MQERAWNSRIILCTRFYSCIESVFASFQLEEEKEVAKKIQMYLPAAISQFAALNDIPALPKLNSNDNKTKSNGIHKVNLPENLISIATPRVAPRRKVVNTI